MKKKNIKKINSPVYYIGTLIMLVLLFVAPAVAKPWAAGITQEGVSLACIFIGCIIGILTTNDLILSALFSMGALVVYGIFTPAGVVAAYMGTPVVWQVIALYALCYVIVRDGTGETLARFILTRKVTQKYPLLMIIILMVTVGIASAFMGVWGALMVGFTLLDSIYEEAKIDRQSKFAKLLYLGAFICMTVSPMAMGGMQAMNLAVGQFFMDAVGVSVIGFKFVVYAWLLVLVFSVAFALCMKYIFRCDIHCLARVDLRETFGTENTSLSRRQIIPLVAFLVIAIYSFTSALWPDSVPFISSLKNMGIVLFTTIVLAVLVLIRVDGEQIFNPAEAFKEGVNWPIVMAIASLACIGGQLVSDTFGIKAWLTEVLGGVLSASNPMLLVLLTIVLTVALTNFFSNTATLYVMSALVATLSGPLVAAGFNITVLPVAICMSSQVAFLTYASSGQAAILLSKDNMDNKFIWTYGLAVILIWVVTTLGISALLSLL